MEDLIIPKRVLDKKRLKEETTSFVSADFFPTKLKLKRLDHLFLLFQTATQWKGARF